MSNSAELKPETANPSQLDDDLEAAGVSDGATQRAQTLQPPEHYSQNHVATSSTWSNEEFIGSSDDEADVLAAAEMTSSNGDKALYRPLRRLTSRAQILKKSSLILLRGETNPTLMRKFSGFHLFPENDSIRGIEFYYYTGWISPYIHYRKPDGNWTALNGIPLEACKKFANQQLAKPQQIVEQVSSVDLGKNTCESTVATECCGCTNLPPPIDSSENVFFCQVPQQSLEFVINQDGKYWDKAPGNKNYHINEPGCYFLRRGVINEVVPPPDKPIMLQSTEVSCSNVMLKWNQPLMNPQLVFGYRLYRNDKLLKELGEDEREHKDSGVLGLMTYTYKVSAINKYHLEGPFSDPCTVHTPEPGKPSAPTELTCLSQSSKLIELSWKNPIDNAGAPIAYFCIYRDHNCYDVLQIAGENTNNWTDLHVEAGKVYVYEVSATHSSPGSASKVTTAPVCAHKFGDLANEGMLSEPLEVKAVDLLEMPRIGDGKPHIILQCFNWRSSDNKDGWYKVLMSQIGDINGSGITMAWLPPPSQSVSKQGYMPTRWYNLDSSYGTKEELIKLNNMLHESSIASMLDLVVNHRSGVKQDSRGEWTIFEDPDWTAWAIVSNNATHYIGTGHADTGDQCVCAPDIDHTNPKVQQDIKNFLNFLVKNIGFKSIRIDMAPGYSARYQLDYVNSAGRPFTVGEYWHGSVDALQNYISSTQRNFCAYDFPFYYVLRRCVENGNFSELRNDNRLNGLIGIDPDRAVTFVDNHDTDHINFIGLFAKGNMDAVLRGYAIILTHPGIPCLYWNYWSDYGELCRRKLQELCNFRKQKKIYSGSGIYIARAEVGLYAAYISDKSYCQDNGGVCAIKVGRANWSPPNNSNWRVYTSGNDYCVWGR